MACGVITAKASGRGQHNRKENMNITQKMYDDYLESMKDEDWKNIRAKIERDIQKQLLGMKKCLGCIAAPW